MRVRLILVWLVWLVSCTTNQVSPLAVTGIPPTPDTTRTPAAFYTPTPLASDPLVAALLANLSGDCRTLCALQTLEYLHAHPQSPYRAELADGLLNASWNEMPMDWFAEMWLNEKLIAPLDQDARAPTEFLAWLERDDHGEWLETDLDDDGAADYLVTLRWGAQFYPGQMNGGLYWVHRTGEKFSLTRIPTRTPRETNSLRPWLRAVRDLNGDGRTDVAFVVSECGNGCLDFLRIVTWDDGRWRNLWSANDWAVDGGYAFDALPDRTTEILATEREGPTVGSGPIHDYTVHFRYVGSAFVPVALSSALPREAWDKYGKPIQLAQRLLYARQVRDALWVLDSIADDLQPAPRAVDVRPYFWHHKAMAHLLAGTWRAPKTRGTNYAPAFPMRW
ncbi:MAG: VCBS repeat-containing protein [Chloroflexi bacterium]|nr:VCBS repeat-containing protein [Chloroflexota bacterium]